MYYCIGYIGIRLSGEKTKLRHCTYKCKNNSINFKFIMFAGFLRISKYYLCY